MGCDIGPLYDNDQGQEIGELEKIIKLTCNSTFTSREYAEALYNAGYRKESETAKEIYDELHKQFCGADGQYRQIIYDCGEGERLEDIEDLIDWKKYGVEIENETLDRRFKTCA